MYEYETGLVWLRRDLRLFDHAALHHALRRCRRVWCACVFDTDILEPLLQRGLRVDRRVDFILASLAEVDAGLREQTKSGANKDAAVAVGKLIAERAMAAGVTKVVFDRGGHIYHGRIKALADAAREGGLAF